ncbi:hypothetical protein ACJDU8_00505 [Clostridium sp. WILCCON 0269]|uniref:ABC transporter permease n=1 Tax=Candidatus Clostridium eludens TaxID=3381663 RepID=A0ABW8SFR8_9CLOT
MKKLLWKEWIYGKWLMFLVTFILLISNSQMFAEYIDNLRCSVRTSYGYIDYSFVHYFSISGFYAYISILLIIFITFVMGFAENLNNQQELISTMPFSKKKLIISKWLGIVICFMIPLIINFIVLNIMYFVNYDKMRIYNNYTEFLMWMILSIFTYIFVITFVMFVDLFFGNKLAGAFLNGLVLLMWVVGKELVAGFLNIYHINIVFGGPIGELYSLPYYNTVHGHNPIYKIFILILFTILLFILMVKIHDLAPIENIGNISIYPKISSVFIIFVSVTFTLLITDIVSESFWGKNASIVITIFTIACFIILYLVIGKIVKYVDGEV